MGLRHDLESRGSGGTCVFLNPAEATPPCAPTWTRAALPSCLVIFLPLPLPPSSSLSQVLAPRPDGGGTAQCVVMRCWVQGASTE